MAENTDHRVARAAGKAFGSFLRKHGIRISGTQVKAEKDAGVIKTLSTYLTFKTSAPLPNITAAWATLFTLIFSRWYLTPSWGWIYWLIMAIATAIAATQVSNILAHVAKSLNGSDWKILGGAIIAIQLLDNFGILIPVLGSFVPLCILIYIGAFGLRTVRQQFSRKSNIPAEQPEAIKVDIE